MEMDVALAWAAQRTGCVLVTIRKDGRPQSSDVAYWLHEGVFDISVTDGRAKTANLRRDPRAVLHITERAEWAYLSFDGTVELLPVAADPDDATVDALVAYFRGVQGEHDDWDDYRRAMVDDRRLIARFTPASVVGQVPTA